MKLNLGNAWTDAMAMLRGQTEILLVLAGTFLLLPALAAGFFMPFEASDSPVLATRIAELRAHIMHFWPWILLAGLVTSFGQIAILKMLLDRARPTVSEALSASLRILPWFYLANLITSLMVGAGILVLIVPGLYLLGRTALTGTAIVAEGISNPIDAVRRSFAVSRGNGWALMLLIAIVVVTGFIVTAALGMVVGVVAALAGNPTLALFLTALIDGLSGAVLGLIMLLCYVAAYRQLSGR